MKKLFCSLLAFLLCLLFFFPALPLPIHATAAESPSMQEARSALLLHLDRNAIICAKEESTPVGAGPTVKIMAGLLLCEALADRKDEKIEITREMMEEVPDSPGYALKLVEGDILTVSQLLKVAICGSYNDAFYLLGAYVYGSTEAFLKTMNARAAMIGADDTTYTDVTGINSGSQTTAKDLAKIALTAYQNAWYMELCDMESFHLTTDGFTKRIYNRNALISDRGGILFKYYNKYCFGMNAGSTPADGNCVVTVAKRDGEQYLCIVLGGEETDTEEYGYIIVNRLLEWVYKTYTYIEVLSAERDVCTVPVTVSDLIDEIPLRTAESFSAYLPKGTDIESEIQYSICLDTPTLEAPVKSGTVVGNVAVIYQGEVLGRLPLYTAADVERSTFIGVIEGMQDLLKNRAVVAGTLFFVIVLSAWIIIEYVLHRRRKHRWDKYFSDKIETPNTAQKRKTAQELKPTRKK